MASISVGISSDGVVTLQTVEGDDVTSSPLTVPEAIEIARGLMEAANRVRSVARAPRILMPGNVTWH